MEAGGPGVQGHPLLYNKYEASLSLSLLTLSLVLPLSLMFSLHAYIVLTKKKHIVYHNWAGKKITGSWRKTNY